MNDTQTIEILKSLRPHAMADVYEASRRLAPHSAPSTDELLAHMAEAEQSARHARSTERMLKRAALRIPASLDEPSFSPERDLDRDLVSRLGTIVAAQLPVSKWRVSPEFSATFDDAVKVPPHLVTHLHPRGTASPC